MSVSGLWLRWQLNFFERRLPLQQEITFNHRNILLFPTEKGALFLFAAALIFIAGTNYQNSLLVIFSMFMVSIMLASVGFTYSNLSGLVLHGVGADTAYAGQAVVFKFRVSVAVNRRNSLRHRIQICSIDGTQFDEQNVDGQTLLSLPLKSRYRGWFKVPRVRIQTEFPMGLMRAWSLPHADAGAWIYPAPLEPIDSDVGMGMAEEGFHPSKEEGDEWESLSPYKAGDPVSHIHWKSLAQGKELLSKRFSRPASVNLWLDWDDYPGAPTELRLSWLCYRIRTLSASDQPYGLRLPGFEKNPDFSSAHRIQCLLALAQFGRPPVEMPMPKDAESEVVE